MVKSRKNGRLRKGAGGGGGRQVAALDLIQMNEFKLATRKDRFVARGKTILFASLTGVTIFSLNLTPLSGAFGSRMQAANLIFARYRFVKLLFRTLAPAGGSMAFGLLDDVISSPGTLPTTENDVMQLRCSSFTFPSQTTPTIIEWKPVDAAKWYYTQADVAGDARFTVALGLIAFSTVTISQPFEIHYTLEFEGATDDT